MGCPTHRGGPGSSVGPPCPKFAAYAGLVPKSRDSGERVAVHAKLRHGSPRLKWAFLVAMQALLKTQRGRFVLQFRRLEKRPGRPKALMAVADRLAFPVYGVWKTGRLYEEGTRRSASGSGCNRPVGRPSARRCPRATSHSTRSLGGRQRPEGPHDPRATPRYLTGRGGELPEEELVRIMVGSDLARVRKNEEGARPLARVNDWVATWAAHC